MMRGVVVKAKNLCSFNEARLLGWLLSSVGVVAIGVNWGVGPLTRPTAGGYPRSGPIPLVRGLRATKGCQRLDLPVENT